MRADMALMAEHGIRHPTIYQSHRQSHRITEVLSIRQAGGVSNDTIFYLGANLGPAFLRADLASVKVAVEATLPLFRAVGSESVFYYGVDEGDPKALEVQQPGWSLVREIGAGVFVAGRYEYLREHYAPKSVFVIAYAPRADASRAAHAHGARVLAYSTPQTGVANPLLFRRNYGLRLWQAKYDGFMLYAYQHAFGSSWDDSDGKYRDHLLAYPTTSGAIPALALKGVREGIYDLLYLETLEKTANAIRSQCSTDLVVLRALSFLGALRNDQDRGKDLDKLRADVARILEELATAERACRSGVVTGSESQWALGGVQG
jgi:hypothetical protein